MARERDVVDERRVRRERVLAQQLAVAGAGRRAPAGRRARTRTAGCGGRPSCRWRRRQPGTSTTPWPVLRSPLKMPPDRTRDPAKKWFPNPVAMPSGCQPFGSGIVSGYGRADAAGAAIAQQHERERQDAKLMQASSLPELEDSTRGDTHARRLWVRTVRDRDQHGARRGRPGCGRDGRRRGAGRERGRAGPAVRRAAPGSCSTSCWPRPGSSASRSSSPTWSRRGRPATATRGPAEVAHHMPWLEAQLALIQPQLVVPLGRHALAHFSDARRSPRSTARRSPSAAGRCSRSTTRPRRCYNQSLRATLFEDARALGARAVRAVARRAAACPRRAGSRPRASRRARRRGRRGREPRAGRGLGAALAVVADLDRELAVLAREPHGRVRWRRRTWRRS